MDKGYPLGRRMVILGAGATFLGGIAHGQAPSASGTAPEIVALEARLGGRLGFSALDTGNGRRMSYRGGERFAMCSTFKWLLAADVLRHVEQGRLSLDQRVPYSSADLLSYAPFTRDHLAEGSLPVGDLCAAAVELSDNTAANLLLRLIGGPRGLTDYLRGLGDQITRLDRNEPSLNSNNPGDERDTTTPDAMIKTMTRILVGDALSPASRTRLLTWMKNCRTGLGRLRAGLPPDWTAGDKTGTGVNGAANDDAIFWPPGRAPILVAAYLSGSAAPAEALNAAHASLGKIIATRLV